MVILFVVVHTHVSALELSILCGGGREFELEVSIPENISHPKYYTPCNFQLVHSYWNTGCCLFIITVLFMFLNANFHSHIRKTL